MFFHQEILLSYEEGINSDMESVFIMTILCAILLLFMVIEFSCYIAIYYYINNHDSSMLSLSIISRDTYKKRQRTNIISFTGQFFCFLAEWISIATLIIWINIIENYDVTNFKEVYYVVRLGEFGLTSLIQVLASSELRALLISSILKYVI